MKVLVRRGIFSALAIALTCLTVNSARADMIAATLMEEWSVNAANNSNHEAGAIIGNAGGSTNYYTYLRYSISDMMVGIGEVAQVTSLMLDYAGGGTINSMSFPSVSVARVLDDSTALNSPIPTSTGFASEFDHGSLPDDGLGGIDTHQIDILSLLTPSEIANGNILNEITIRIRVTGAPGIEGYLFDNGPSGSNDNSYLLMGQFAAVPEATSFALFATGLASIGFIRRRRV